MVGTHTSHLYQNVMKTQIIPPLSKPKQPTAAQLAGGLIISVGEARKVLGGDAKDLSDDEVIVMIYELSEIAQTLLKNSSFIG